MYFIRDRHPAVAPVRSPSAGNRQERAREPRGEIASRVDRVSSLPAHSLHGLRPLHQAVQRPDSNAPAGLTLVTGLIRAQRGDGIDARGAARGSCEG